MFRDTQRRTAELQRTNLLLERQDGVGYRVRSVPLGDRRTALQGPGGELYDPARRVTEREREDGEPEAWVVYRRRHRLFDAGDPWSPTAVG